jgi:hypothetical protein
MSEDEKQEDQQTDRRTVPQSDLDFNLMTTDPVWGSNQVSPELQKKLSETIEGISSDGKPVFKEAKLWGLLNYYTRDVRLGNLSKWDELPYVEYYLNLAGDFLQVGMIKPFLVALSRAATKIELSQSKNGFLRRRLSTFTKEEYKTENEPAKKNIFGGKKKEE